jgi:PRONE (Plant-specific Rop nucleotide exchanger)
MAINSNALAEMDVPESYLESLPKVCLPLFFCNGTFAKKVLTEYLGGEANVKNRSIV